jgi:hypothetical protein
MTATYPSAATNNAGADHKNRARDLGLRLTTTNSCPRRLANKPHLEWECWCTSRLNDHGRRYRDHDNQPVILWEPYNADGAELLEVFEAAETDGLWVEVMGESPWNPGHTFALFFRASDE